MPEKLATCCYCGRRTALRVMDHALVCGSCGAPLRDMKPLPVANARAAASHAATPQPHKMPDRARKKTRATPIRGKKRKSVWKRFADGIEDIFDEIEDIFD